MTIKKYFSSLNNKKIALLGLGLDHQALITLFAKYNVKAEITICDKKQQTNLPTIASNHLSITWQTGKKYNNNLNRFDIIFRSPGWPLWESSLKSARQAGREITSSIQLFIDLCPSQKIIGITGTKGKGTTATLINQILKDAGHNSWLGGNIGLSPLTFLDKIKTKDYVVLELSSFQLEDLKKSPSLAVITNFFPEHLAPADPNNPNFHRSLSAYWQAKLNIARYPKNRWLIANVKLKRRLSTFKIVRRLVFFSASDLPTRLVGQYNQENVGAAVSIAKILKIPTLSYKKTIVNFNNLENRLKLVRHYRDVFYYNNSFATTPESSTLDLDSFSSPIILIAGGADKGADFSGFAKTIQAKVKHLILLPGAGTIKIKKALQKVGYRPNYITLATDMEKAVKAAKKLAIKKDIVLLSTGCASFGLFKNYKERGSLFEKYVKN